MVDIALPVPRSYTDPDRIVPLEIEVLRHNHKSVFHLVHILLANNLLP